MFCVEPLFCVVFRHGGFFILLKSIIGLKLVTLQQEENKGFVLFFKKEVSSPSSELPSFMSAAMIALWRAFIILTH